MTPRTRPFARTVSALITLFWLSFGASTAAAIGFETPSGNIKCYADRYTGMAEQDAPMICLIFEAEWAVEPDTNDQSTVCDLDSTRTLVLHRKGPARELWTCHGDVFWPYPLGAISYGSQWSLRNYTCAVMSDGVTCTNETGNSFSVNRARRILN